MLYPSLNRQSQRKLQIPELSGGVNYADGINHVQDNQLTDCKNMWWYNGALRSRPGTNELNHAYYEFQTGSDFKQDCDPVVYRVENRAYQIFACDTQSEEATNARDFYILAVGVDDDGHPAITHILRKENIQSDYGTEKPLNRLHYILFRGKPKRANGSGVFVLLGGYSQGGEMVYGPVFYELVESMSGSPGVITLQEDDLYTPLVYMNGKGNKYASLPVSEGTEYPAAVAFEGFNRLTGKFEARYMTDGASYKFKLPVENLPSGEIRVELTLDGLSDGTNPISTAVFNFAADATEDAAGYIRPQEETQSGKAYRIESDTANGWFSVKFHRKSGTAFIYGGPDSTGADNVSTDQRPIEMPFSGGFNNLRIFASLFDQDLFDQVLRMKHCVEFGGAEGIYGGSRTFLAGDPSHPGMMIWSDVNNPLYFSENNYAVVGGNDAITGFGKQGNMLVIFKEHSIFYTVLVDGDGLTADNIRDGMDVSTAFATFPIYQLHGEIGCDLPCTIQLCNNRLVWATKNGEVYTLVDGSNNSQNNVYSISRNIEPQLQTADLSSAFAINWLGHYLLFCGSDVFVLDYNKNSYKYVAGNSQAGSNQFTWWVWEMQHHLYDDDGNVTGVCNYFGAVANGEQGALTAKSTDSSGNVTLHATVFERDLGESNYYPFESMFQTKCFDFNAPETYKNIDKVYAGINSEKNDPIAMDYLTEQGTADAPPIETGFVINSQSLSQTKLMQARYDGAYNRTKRLPVRLPRVMRFGLKMTSPSSFTVNGLSIYYTPTGNVK